MTRRDFEEIFGGVLFLGALFVLVVIVCHLDMVNP